MVIVCTINSVTRSIVVSAASHFDYGALRTKIVSDLEWLSLSSPRNGASQCLYHINI